MKHTLIALSLLALLAACNTIDGAGQDIQKAGAWTSKKAGQTKEKM